MKSLTYVEIDCDVFRLTRFEGARADTAIGAWSSQWATGGTLTGVADGDLPSGLGARLVRTGGDDHTLFSWSQVPALDDSSAIALLRANAAGTAVRMGIVLRGSGILNSEGGYVLDIAASTLTIRKAVAGTVTQLEQVATTVNEEENYYFRFDAFDTDDGVLLRAKQWQGTLADEPEDFTISVTDDTSPVTSAGLSGLYGFDDAADFSCGLFRVRSLYGATEETLRFSMPVAYLPKDIDAIPSIKSVGFQPMTLSLGESLGQRATITVGFSDHKSADLGELYESGTYFSRFKARKLFRRGQNVRIIRGLLGQAIEEMDARHYIAESFEGPDPQGGSFTLVAKDVLKLADDERAQAPVLSNGFLSGSIDLDDTAATLEPAGIGNLEYPASGYVCIGGNEVCAFTRTADALTLTRAQLGSVASTHNADDRVQLVLRYAGDDVADIINDLLTNYTEIPDDFIPLADWQAETAANLSTIYTATITEPTSVKKLVDELIEQAALAVWWDDMTRLIRLQVLKEIATNADTFDENRILSGSLSTKEQPDKRISQIWTMYGRRDPTKGVDDEDNYRNSLARVDLERELEYGTPSIRKIKARFIGTQPSADRLNQVQMSRFRDPPRRFTFDLFRGTPIQMGGGYRLSWWGDVDESGERRSNGARIQVTHVKIEPDMIHVEAEEMLASGVIVLRHMVLLTTTGGVLSWGVPASFNVADNLVECLGGGGGGDRHGGGGAAYASKANVALTPSGTAQYRVGAKGVGEVVSFFGPVAATAGGDTWFNGATFGAASAAAKGGLSGASRTGGQAASSIGDVKFSGGTGGDDSPDNGGGGGGGAAAGPHGNGGNGGDGNTGNSGNGGSGGGGGADGGSNGTDATGGDPEDAGRGGNNRFGVGGGVPGNPNGQNGGGGAGNSEADSEGPPGNGSVEEQWTQTSSPIFSAGPGSGPGGGGERSNGVDAPNYGAGGSGRGGHASRAGNGSQGCIVISWTEA